MRRCSAGEIVVLRFSGFPLAESLSTKNITRNLDEVLLICAIHVSETCILSSDVYKPHLQVLGTKCRIRMSLTQLEKGSWLYLIFPMGKVFIEEGEQETTHTHNPDVLPGLNKVSIIPLVFLIYYEVSGGPFGVEDSVKAGGPLLALLGFLVFPIIWSIPEALVTAEMGTMFPENGGYVVWVSCAFGPFWGFQQGWMKWLSGVIDNALYPVLFLDYFQSAIPALEGGIPRVITVLILTFGLTYVNYRGLNIVGWTAVFLGVFSLLPFCVMGLISIPRLDPARWVVVDIGEVDWNLYLNTLFWNLNYWDSISTLAGEVDNPGKTLPKALFWGVVLVVLSYFVPLLCGTGAVELDRSQWQDGYFAIIAKMLGGVWLRWWMEAAAAVSNMGMFEAEMSSDSFQLLGMAERGMLPEVFGVRSRYGTPLLGILFSASGVLLLSSLSFQEIIAAENYLYCFGMILEFAAFIWLRIKKPTTPRPYKIPLGTAGVVLMCIPPSVLLCLVLWVASMKVMIVSISAIIIGLLLYPGIEYLKKKNWMKFSISSDLAAGGDPVAQEEVRLLSEHE